MLPGEKTEAIFLLVAWPSLALGSIKVVLKIAYRSFLTQPVKDSDR